jgi:hypothetical protein
MVASENNGCISRTYTFASGFKVGAHQKIRQLCGNFFELPVYWSKMILMNNTEKACSKKPDTKVSGFVLIVFSIMVNQNYL